METSRFPWVPQRTNSSYREGESGAREIDGGQREREKDRRERERQRDMSIDKRNKRGQEIKDHTKWQEVCCL